MTLEHSLERGCPWRAYELVGGPRRRLLPAGDGPAVRIGGRRVRARYQVSGATSMPADPARRSQEQSPVRRRPPGRSVPGHRRTCTGRLWTMRQYAASHCRIERRYRTCWQRVNGLSVAFDRDPADTTRRAAGAGESAMRVAIDTRQSALFDAIHSTASPFRPQLAGRRSCWRSCASRPPRHPFDRPGHAERRAQEYVPAARTSTRPRRRCGPSPT